MWKRGFNEIPTENAVLFYAKFSKWLYVFAFCSKFYTDKMSCLYNT